MLQHVRGIVHQAHELFRFFAALLFDKSEIRRILQIFPGAKAVPAAYVLRSLVKGRAYIAQVVFQNSPISSCGDTLYRAHPTTVRGGAMNCRVRVAIFSPWEVPSCPA